MTEGPSGNADRSVPQVDSPSERGPDPLPVLCVDLDNTLIRTDLLWEGVLQLLVAKPFALARFPRALLSGKAAFKAWIAQQVTIDPALLPYNESVLSLVRTERETGRRVVLATAADRKLATAVADHLQFFHTVIATDQGINRIGHAKLKAVRNECGVAGFDYVGDSRMDLPLWAEANVAHVVSPDRRLLQQVQQVCRPRLVGATGESRTRAFVQLLRPRRWSMNLLLLTPLVLSHSTDVSKWLIAFLAVICFCLAASAGYIMNDLCDLPSDRRDPRKRHRPVACGHVSIREALFVAGLLITLGIGLSLVVLPWLPLLVIGYLALTLTYSVWLKRAVLLQVLYLTGLCIYRVFAGGLVTEIGLSSWFNG